MSHLKASPKNNGIILKSRCYLVWELMYMRCVDVISYIYISLIFPVWMPPSWFSHFRLRRGVFSQVLLDFWTPKTHKFTPKSWFYNISMLIKAVKSYCRMWPLVPRAQGRPSGFQFRTPWATYIHMSTTKRSWISEAVYSFVSLCRLKLEAFQT